MIGEVTLTSGAIAPYFARRQAGDPAARGFLALGELVAARAADWGATAVGG